MQQQTRSLAAQQSRAQLRNHKVRFVSAGNTQMHEPIMEELEITESRQQDEDRVPNNNLNTSNDICFTDSLDMRRTGLVNDTIPPLHSSSPPTTDSSEDEVVFPGRINCTNWLHRSFIQHRDIENAAKPNIYYRESLDPCALRTPEDFVFMTSRQHGGRKETLLDEARMGVDYIENMDTDEESIDELSERFSASFANMNIDQIGDREPASPSLSSHGTPEDISCSDISLTNEQVLSKNGKGAGNQHPKTTPWNTGGNLTMFGLRDEEIAELPGVIVPRHSEMESEQDIATAELLHNAGGLQQATVSGLKGRAARPKRMKQKNKARMKQEFLAASAPADTLERGSYSRFGITGFSQPNSMKKSKGKSFTANLELSDSELDLERVWGNDRLKKKIKKQQREELRSNGLLGQVTEKVDLNAKYSRSMTVNDLKAEMMAFLLSPYESLPFPPMNKRNRKLVHNLANSVSLKSQSRGRGGSRFPIVYKTSRTSRYTDETISKVEQIFSRSRFDNHPGPSFDQRNYKGRKTQRVRSDAAVSYTDGDIVGASAPEIGADNKGRAMLEKMGWSIGTALGSMNNKGILQPVEHVVKNSRTGLG